LAYPPENYLQSIRHWADEEGIVLIFDEIMSAFRLANGGAQEIYQVQPDLVTVGKGMANGLPLAALAGPDRLMHKAHAIGYGPTFQGEIYALAAANAALEIYRSEPVCRHLNEMGRRLQDGIRSAAVSAGIPLHLEGIAPRLVPRFQSLAGYAEPLLRTFFIQELLHGGILFGGTFLPSYTHTDADIRYTLGCIQPIFKAMRDAIQSETLPERISIPLHTLYLGERND
jgi:glutamate-1-semialdehyde aminotransferase